MTRSVLLMPFVSVFVLSSLSFASSGSSSRAAIKCENKSYSYTGGYTVDFDDAAALTGNPQSLGVTYEGFTGPDGDGEYQERKRATALYSPTASKGPVVTYTFDGYVIQINQSTRVATLYTQRRGNYSLTCAHFTPLSAISTVCKAKAYAAASAAVSKYLPVYVCGSAPFKTEFSNNQFVFTLSCVGETGSQLGRLLVDIDNPNNCNVLTVTPLL